VEFGAIFSHEKSFTHVEIVVFRKKFGKNLPPTKKKKTIDFSTCGAQLCNGWNWNQCFFGDKFCHFFKKKIGNFLEFFFLSVNSIEFSFLGIFRQHFHLTTLRRKTKKNKKNKKKPDWNWLGFEAG
jgi:hypothetical protein